jgi:hypothetical protein
MNFEMPLFVVEFDLVELLWIVWKIESLMKMKKLVTIWKMMDLDDIVLVDKIMEVEMGFDIDPFEVDLYVLDRNYY